MVSPVKEFPTASLINPDFKKFKLSWDETAMKAVEVSESVMKELSIIGGGGWLAPPKAMNIIS